MPARAATSTPTSTEAADAGLVIHLLGPVRITRGGLELALPRSRKLRVLLAFLALAPAPLSRTRLCDLFWKGPNDPRGELRWCLSRLRALLDGPRRRVVSAAPALVSLDLGDSMVDAIALDRAVRAGVAGADTPALVAIAERLAGDLLEGTEVDTAELAGWLLGQRQRLREQSVIVLAELARRAEVASAAQFRFVEAWLARAPLDVEAHACLLRALLACGRAGDAEAHVGATLRACARDGHDGSALTEAWHAVRREAGGRASVEVSLAPGPPSAEPAPRPGSVLVMPFASPASRLRDCADGLTEDLIARLAQLRLLFVIARGTSYALGARGLDARAAGRAANVDYAVTGTVRPRGDRVLVEVELAETRGASILWTEATEETLDEGLVFLDRIAARIAAAVAEQIEQAECKRAVLAPVDSLDAWQSYHRGLWHMYRFTADDNRRAAELFTLALARDPTFARAYAGISFTHFQNVFLALSSDREGESRLALDAASRSLAADDRDPGAHWAMGRALWLRGEPDAAIAELERSVALGPSFALAHYTLGFVHAQNGDPAVAISATDHARALSPFDPLQFAMLAARALAHVRLGDHEAAADWAVSATRRPNAHVHILAIAATTLALARRQREAIGFVDRMRAAWPRYGLDDMLRAFHFTPDTERQLRSGARRIGFG